MGFASNGFVVIYKFQPAAVFGGLSLVRTNDTCKLSIFISDIPAGHFLLSNVFIYLPISISTSQIIWNNLVLHIDLRIGEESYIRDMILVRELICFQRTCRYLQVSACRRLRRFVPSSDNCYMQTK